MLDLSLIMAVPPEMIILLNIFLYNIAKFVSASADHMHAAGRVKASSLLTHQVAGVYILTMENADKKDTLIPQKWKILSGSALKTIALVCMIIDHVAHYLPHLFTAVLFTTGSGPKTVYWLLRCIGRLAFPIYCFLLVEGFLHTKNRWKYAVRLLIFALISEIPWNLVHGKKLTYPSQNVFFTLFLGLCGLILFEYFEDNRLMQMLSLIALMAVSMFFKADYGVRGYGFIIMMYALRNVPLLQAVCGCCLHNDTWKAGLAFIPINLYNGKRGWIKGRFLQYAFYAVYPLHLFILYLIIK